MSYFLEKSEQNKRASDLLWNSREHRCWAPIAHCSLYSCTLLILHLLIEKRYYTREAITSKCKELKKGTNEGVIHLASLKLGELKSKNLALYSSEIKQLKEIREDMDYFNIEATEIIAKKAIDLRNRVLNILNQDLK